MPTTQQFPYLLRAMIGLPLWPGSVARLWWITWSSRQISSPLSSDLRDLMAADGLQLLDLGQPIILSFYPADSNLEDRLFIQALQTNCPILNLGDKVQMGSSRMMRQSSSLRGDNAKVESVGSLLIVRFFLEVQWQVSALFSVKSGKNQIWSAFLLSTSEKMLWAQVTMMQGVIRKAVPELVALSFPLVVQLDLRAPIGLRIPLQ